MKSTTALKIVFLGWLALAILLTPLFLLWADDGADVSPKWLPVVRVTIHDADTIKGDVVLPLGVQLAGRSIRASGYDAWEVDRNRSRSAEFKGFTDEQWATENARGVHARDELTKLARGGQWYIEPVDDNAAYGRIEAKLFVVVSSGRVVDVKTWATENGHVRK